MIPTTNPCPQRPFIHYLKILPIPCPHGQFILHAPTKRKKGGNPVSFWYNVIVEEREKASTPITFFQLCIVRFAFCIFFAMRLIFIRHAEPDYSVDGLTPPGYREAEALARRVAKWPVTAVFCSPLGRAQLTAEPCLEALHMEAETLDWLREVDSGVHVRPDGSEHRSSCPWDLFPDYWVKDELHFHPETWVTSDYIQSLPKDVAELFCKVSDGVDGILARYGYHREGRHYRIDADARREANLVFFCHLGLIGMAAGHILNISPMQLWHSFWLSPSSVSILPTEERQGDIAGFRCQVMGDVSHLLAAGEPVSNHGGFISEAFEL